MNITELASRYSVSPQIELSEIEEIKSLGFDVVINNRPDGEADDQPTSEQIQQAVESAGMQYVYNPVDLSKLTNVEVAKQAEAVQGAGKAFAYCRTGTRSSVLWVLANHQDEGTFISLVAEVMKKGFDLGRCLPAMERLKKS